ncbi:MAG: hypothetical protein ACOCV2_05650, partial [Persicimonas sp.]
MTKIARVNVCLVLFLSLLSGVACSDNVSEDEPSDAGMSGDGADEDGEQAQWQQELEGLQEDSATIFSLAYSRDEEELLTGTLLPEVEDDACSTYVDWVSESPP